jgi:cytochrome b6-f complex iron-sulfur subunit
MTEHESGSETEAAAGPAKVAAKPKPAAAKKPGAAKPPAKAAAAAKTEKRRFFLLEAVNAAWLAFALANIAALLAFVRFMFPNVLAEPPSQFKTRPKELFEPGSVNNEWKDKFQVWIVYLDDERRLVALSTICTHLGCSPSWLEADQKFKCPCHGSGFYKTGINFEGPAPRPLERFRVFEVDGVVAVDKSKKFQFELGQWNEPESYLPM